MKQLRISKKGDWYFIFAISIITIVTGICISFHGVSSNALVAEISRDGKLIQKIDLNSVKDSQYIVFNDGIKLTVLAEKGRIKVLDADCPDKICVKTGWLTKPGDMAVCVPSQTIVMIAVPDK